MIVDSIRFKGHTCFKTGWSGFDTVKPINVIIGRNNSGKSHLLDLVETLCSGRFNERGWQYRCAGTVDRASLERAFPREALIEPGGLSYWQAYGSHFVDAEVAWETDQRGGVVDLTFLDGRRPEPPSGQERLHGILGAKTHRLTGKSFRRLSADRDIDIEPPTLNLSLGRSGRGASNLVRRFLVVRHVIICG